MMESSVVEAVADWAERGTVAFTILAAASGLIFVVASRQVKRLEAIRAEAKDARISDDLKTKDLAIAKLELDAATQRERAAKAEKSLLELQEDFAPREFNKDEFHALVQLLKRGPRGRVDIVFHSGHPETRQFAGWLASALQVSGWTVSSMSEMALAASAPADSGGVTIVVRDGGRAPVRLKTLHDALVGAVPSLGRGRVWVFTDPKLDADAVRLSVWPKPMTPRARW